MWINNRLWVRRWMCFGGEMLSPVELYKDVRQDFASSCEKWPWKWVQITLIHKDIYDSQRGELLVDPQSWWAKRATSLISVVYFLFFPVFPRRPSLHVKTNHFCRDFNLSASMSSLWFLREEQMHVPKTLYTWICSRVWYGRENVQHWVCHEGYGVWTRNYGHC